MKKLHLLTILSLFIVGLSNVQSADEPQKTPGDTEISQKIVGVWIVDVISPNGISVKGTVTVVSDNKFISKSVVTIGDKKQQVEYEGIWQVKEGFLTEKITKSNSKIAPVGTVTRDKIIRVNDQELVYETEQNKTVTRKRGK